jgi:5-methylcytosine-specific restriction endonuclease McrA
MCRGRGKPTCTELGIDSAHWSRVAPLMPPAYFDGQLIAFNEAVRHASIGDAEKARAELRLIRSDVMQSWFIEHGQQSGYFRDKRFRRSKPAATVARDSTRLSKRIELEVFARDGDRCRYCGVRLVPLDVLKAFGKVVGRDAFRATGTNLERHGVVLAFRANADHVVPWTLGGRTDLDNLVSACWGCNFGKSNYTLDQIGVEDPRSRPIPCADGWDGLVSYLPALKANAMRAI